MKSIRLVTLCGVCRAPFDCSQYKGESIPCGHDVRKAVVVPEVTPYAYVDHIEISLGFSADTTR